MNNRAYAMNRYHSLLRQAGMTLIELMIAMVLGLLVVAAVLYAFQNSQQSFRYSDTMSRMQENARMSLETMGNDLRLTSYAGCGSVSNMNFQSLVSSPDIAFDDASVIKGRSYASPDPVVGASGAASSDIVVVKHLSESVVRLNQPVDNRTDPIVLKKTPATPTYKTGQIVTIANCQAINTFRVTNVADDTSTITLSHGVGSGTTGNTQAALKTDFSVAATVRIARLVEQSYYVKNTGRRNTAGQAIFALYRGATLNGVIEGTPAEEELAEGVERMLITYGLDNDGASDGIIDSYVPTASMTNEDWAKVVSVRVELLVASVEDSITDVAQPYTFNGNSVTPTDRKMRTSVSTTISLRNRIHSK